MLRAIFLSLILSFVQLCFAEEVDNLYISLVPVADQTATSKRQGSIDAFKNVLIKLTGNSEIVTLAPIKALLENSTSFIDALSYEELPANLSLPELSSSSEIGLRVSFSRSAIDEMIREIKLPVLPSNRPKLIIWIVKDDVESGREFLGESSVKANENSIGARVLNDLKSIMMDRGIPFMLPTYDLEDQLALSIEAAWNLDAKKISVASRKYDADGWIAIRFYKSSAGEVRGAWLFKAGDVQETRDFNTKSNDSFLVSIMDSMIDNLVTPFSYIPQQESNMLFVEIRGISSIVDYQRVSKQLLKLELVNSIDLFSVRGDEIQLSVASEGDAGLLHRALIRSGQFRARNTIEVKEKSLSFNWVSK